MLSGLRSRISALLVTGVTEPPAPRPAWQRRGRFDLAVVADVVVALICFAIINSTLRDAVTRQAASPDAGVLALVALALCAPLVLRAFLPLTSWSACALASLWASWVLSPISVTGRYIPAVLIYALCLYAVAVRCKPWAVASAGVVTVLVSTAVEGQDTVTVIFFAAIPVFAGLIVRWSRRAGREQLESAERRHEGERALLEERQRIARELHDVVAHHMSVIAIQAEAAPYKAANPPPELVESFSEIRASALSGLNELRRVLGVLRSERAEVAPQPGLEDLDDLLESARGGGVGVTTSITGTPRTLPAGVNLSAYRIVQEALSNAMRHAPGSGVQVRLYYGEAVLVIEVRNNGGAPVRRAGGGQPGRPGLGEGGGHGIIGMRERAAMLGGHLEAGPTKDDEFLVTAALPLAPDGSEDTP